MTYHLFTCLFDFCPFFPSKECKLHEDKDILFSFPTTPVPKSIVCDLWWCLCTFVKWANEWVSFCDHSRDVFRPDCSLLLICSKIRLGMAPLPSPLFFVCCIVLNTLYFQAEVLGCAQALWAYPTLCDLCTVARQAPLSMGFSRQEHWSGLCAPLQVIFPTQESNPCLQVLLHCRHALHQLSHYT